jgi:hypothetical protein
MTAPWRRELAWLTRQPASVVRAYLRATADMELPLGFLACVRRLL